MFEQTRDAEIAAVENALAALIPSPGQINRDQLMFRAGQASIQPARGWAWPAATTALALVAVGLAGVLALRPQPKPEKEIVVVVKPGPVTPPHEPKKQISRPIVGESSKPAVEEPPYSSTPYLQMQNQLLRWGLDSLPALPPSPPAEPPLTRKDLLDRPAEDAPGLFLIPLNFLQKLGGPS